jgi:hypothetical protein
MHVSIARWLEAYGDKKKKYHFSWEMCFGSRAMVRLIFIKTSMIVLWSSENACIWYLHICRVSLDNTLCCVLHKNHGCEEARKNSILFPTFVFFVLYTYVHFFRIFRGIKTELTKLKRKVITRARELQVIFTIFIPKFLFGPRCWMLEIWKFGDMWLL